MKRHWIEYQDSPPDGPMTYWVHRPVDTQHWYKATEFDPPRQPVVAARGYPLFNIEIDGFTFVFASLVEIQVCRETLGQKLLPRTIDLASKVDRWNCKLGPNAHWLSRLPKDVKSWKYREKAVAYMQVAMRDF